MLHGRLHISRNCGCCSTDRELLEEKSKFLIVRVGQTRPCVVGQIPQATLERTERLLARLVKELLVGVRRLAFVLGILAQPAIDLVAQPGR